MRIFRKIKVSGQVIELIFIETTDVISVPDAPPDVRKSYILDEVRIDSVNIPLDILDPRVVDQWESNV